MLKIVPQNLELKKDILNRINMPKENYKLQGLDNMLPELKLEFYKPFIEKLNQYNIPFNIADNDLRWIGKSKCCCGDELVKKSTDFNTTAMLMKYGNGYNLQNVYDELAGFGDDKCAGVFRSNRQKGVITIRDFMNRNMEITTEDDIKDVGFLKIRPEYLINYLSANGNCACKVLAYLISNMNTKNMVYMTQRELSDNLKISLPTVNKILSDLESYDIIRPFRGKIMINPAFLVYGSSKRRV